MGCCFVGCSVIAMGLGWAQISGAGFCVVYGF